MRRFSPGAWLALLFATLIIGTSTAQVIYRFFLPTDGWAVTGNEVDSPEWLYYLNLVGTPSDLQPFDVLTALDGVVVSAYPDGQRPPFWYAGNTVAYTVARDGSTMTLTVPIVNWTLAAVARLQINELGTLFSTVGSMALLAVAALAFLKRPDDPAARALLVFASVLAAGAISNLLPVGLTAAFDPIASATVLFFNYAIFIALLAPSLLSLTLVFPHPKPIVTRHPWLAYLPFVVGLGLFALLLATGLWQIGWFGTLAMLLLAIASLVHSAVTMRDAVSRAQMAWAVGGLVLGLGLFLLNFPAAFDWVPDAWGYPMTVVASLGIPVMGLGMAMAVLRYRLFDIDVIIRRTTSYAILTALLLLVYFGSVVVLQRLFSSVSGQTSTVAVVLSTLLIAALFFPLRRRVQDAIDRRFFRRKYDAEKVLNAFAATVRDETDLDALTAELVRVIQETMQPQFVNVWLKPVAGIGDIAKGSPIDEAYR